MIRKRKSGFSLIELMIVVAILGILVSVALPEFKSMTDDAKIAKVKENFRTLSDAVIRYINNEPNPPTFLKQLVPGYMQKIPNDPWGNKFIIDSEKSLIISAGEDGKFGTADDFKHTYNFDATKKAMKEYREKLKKIGSTDLFIDNETKIGDYFSGNPDGFLIIIFTNSFDGHSPQFITDIIESGYIGKLIDSNNYKLYLSDFAINRFMFLKYNIKYTPSLYIIDSEYKTKGFLKGYNDKNTFTNDLKNLFSKIK